MAEWTRGARVGAFTLVLVIVGVGMWSFVSKSRVFGGKGPAVFAMFRDATGLAPLSRVTMAGIPVGNLKGVVLTPDGKARLDIQLNPGVELHQDASVAKATATLLSEPYLAVTPGSANLPLIVEGGQITNVIEPVGTDQIMQDVGAIADRVKRVADSLANAVGTQEGEQELKNILRNVEQATAALNEMARENRQSLRTIFANVETITTDARPKAREILDNVRSASVTIDNITRENREDVREITRGVRETVDKADRAGDSLESALKHVDSITAKVDRGEGTVGRLLRDEALIDEVQGAAESVNDLVSGAARLQTVVGLRTDFNFLSNSIKNYVEIRLQPREDKYYSFEFVNDPRGRTLIEQIDVNTTNPNDPAAYREVRTTTSNSLRFSLQFARRLGPFTGRFGIKESTGGLGLDTHLFANRFELQQDLFGFGEQLTPRWRVSLLYEFVKRLWLIGGADNIIFADRRDYFAGGMLRFTDEDLKSILLFAPTTSF